MVRIRGSQEMIAAMAPMAMPGRWHFCAVDATDPRRDRLRGQALASLQEAEGCSLILDEALAQVEGLQSQMPMTQITLQVHSALDGVGLTAAVSTALAVAGIPCNMVAGFHHDHAFVPSTMAEEALAVLSARSAQASAR